MAANSVKILLTAMVGGAFISLLAGAAAQAVTLTFDELADQPPSTTANGLTIEGVTFGFTINGVASDDVYYNPPVPDANRDGVLDSNDDLRDIQWPALDGNADGVLTMDFTAPVETVQFGAALASRTPISPGFIIELFDTELNSLGTTVLDAVLQPDAPNKAAENFFSYNGTPVKRLVFDPNGNFITFTPERTFSIDNLTFISATSVPEPASMSGLLALGAVGAFSLIKRKQNRLLRGRIQRMGNSNAA